MERSAHENFHHRPFAIEFTLRTLHFIPIVHTAVDLGSLAQRAEDARVMRGGEASFEAFRSGVDEFWKSLNEAIRAWQIDFDNLLLYQDSLPITGSPVAEIEHKIVEDLANRGSQNHLALRWLIDRGATLMGTESAELLLEEYTLAKQRLRVPIDDPFGPDDENQDNENQEEQDRDSLIRGNELLRRRDRFIADRINQTLRDDRIGLLFLGLAHRIEPDLASDIKVVYPFGSPNVTSAPETIR